MDINKYQMNYSIKISYDDVKHLKGFTSAFNAIDDFITNIR